MKNHSNIDPLTGRRKLDMSGVPEASRRNKKGSNVLLGIGLLGVAGGVAALGVSTHSGDASPTASISADAGAATPHATKGPIETTNLFLPTRYGEYSVSFGANSNATDAVRAFEAAEGKHNEANVVRAEARQINEGVASGRLSPRSDGQIEGSGNTETQIGVEPESKVVDPAALSHAHNLEIKQILKPGQ